MVMDLCTWTFANVPAQPDEPLLVDACQPSRSLSFNALRCSARKLAKGVCTLGIRPGDCVCVLAFNDIHYSTLYFGIIGAGARFLGLNPSFTEDELSHYFQLAKPKAVIVEPRMLEATCSAAKHIGLPSSSIFLFDIHEDCAASTYPSWTSLLEHGETDWVQPEDPDTATCHYALTSGTSGLPKAALLPHSYHVSQAQARLSNPSLPYKPVRLTPLPPFHVFATPIIPSSIHENITTYVMRRYEASSFLAAISKFSVSETFVAPSIITSLPQVSGCTSEALKSIRQIWFGGASIKHANRLPLLSLLQPSAQINPVWGMTEAGWVTQAVWPESSCDDSTGRPLPGYTLKVVDDSDRIITKAGVHGEILAKCPHPMLGYLENEKATAEAFTADGYVRTGDVGVIDEEGRVYLVDRKKDLIKVRGWQVSPSEIVSKLLQHPEVLDAAVVGVKAEDGVDEWPRAYVVRRAASDVTQEAVKSWLKGHLAGYKIPKEIIFRNALPRSATGKIVKKELDASEEEQKGKTRMGAAGGSWSSTYPERSSKLWVACKWVALWCWARLPSRFLGKLTAA